MYGAYTPSTAEQQKNLRMWLSLMVCITPAPHKDFSDLHEKMSGKGESASEAHRGNC